MQRGCVFIFIGGLQPKKVQVDNQPRPCPECGVPSARLKRLDHYLSLFFIPLFPIKRGEVFLECDRCGGIFSEGGGPLSGYSSYEPFRTCPGCGQRIDQASNFCPNCGERIS